MGYMGQAIQLFVLSSLIPKSRLSGQVQYGVNPPSFSIL